MEEKIMKRLKLKISISKISEEKSKRSFVNKKIVIAACAFLVLTTGLVFSKEIEKITKRLFTNSTKAIDLAVENEYVQNVYMNFVEDKDIGIKVNNIILDEISLDISFCYKVKNSNIKEMRISKYDITTGDGKPINSTEGKYEEIPLANSINWGDHTQVKTSDTTFSDSVLFTLRDLNYNLNEINIEIYEVRLIYDDVIEEVQGKWNFNVEINENMKKSSKVEFKMQGTNDKVEACIGTLSPTGLRIELKLKEPFDMQTWFDENVSKLAEKGEFEEYETVPFYIMKDGEAIIPYDMGGSDIPLNKEEIGKIHVVKYNDISIFEDINQIELHICISDEPIVLVKENNE